jgi:hypothetical protein
MQALASNLQPLLLQLRWRFFLRNKKFLLPLQHLCSCFLNKKIYVPRPHPLRLGAQRLLRNKANHDVLEGFLTVLFGVSKAIIDHIRSGGSDCGRAASLTTRK